MVAQVANAGAVQLLPCPVDFARSVEDRRDRAVGHLACQNTHEIDDICGCVPAVLARAVLSGF